MALSNPTTPVLVSLTGNDIIVVIETTDSAQDFYALFVQLEESDREPVEAWSTLGPELRVPVDSNEQSKFRIEDILKAEFSTHITDPRESVKFSKLKDYVRKYRYKYYERYGANQTKFNETTSVSYYAVQGGIGHLTEKKYAWWPQLQSKKFFLNDMPQKKVTNKIVGELYREKLFWYNYSAITNPSLAIKVYFTDKYPEQSPVVQITSVQHEIYEIEASYINLSITDPNAYAYEVWIEGGGNDLTIRQTFIIDRKFNRRTKYFLYNNKYQLTENVIFTGKFDEGSEYTKQQSLDLLTEETSEYDISEEIPREADSGLISNEWINHLREFYLALKKFEIINYISDGSYNLVPILFDSKKLALPGSEDNLFNQMIKYRFAFSSNFNDNILFISGQLTSPTAKSYDQPTTGSANILEGSTGILTLNGVCYPGSGDVKLIEPYSNTVIGTDVASSLWLINDKGAYANGYTYVTYIDLNTNTRNIIRYNHSNNTWGSAVILATTSFVGGGNADGFDYGHASPSVMIDSNGYINVSYGGRKQGTLYNLRSTNPNDISSWDSEILVESGAFDISYAKLLEVDGDYVLFYRRVDGSDVVLCRIVSIDNGSTWGAELKINDFYPYYSVEVDNNYRVHICWHYFDGSSNRDIYYTYTDDIKSVSPTFYDTEGNSQILPLTVVDCLIFDSGISWENNYLLGMDLDENNRPHIVSLATDSVKTDKLLHFTNRFGTEWIEDTILESNDISNDSPTYGREPVEGDIYCDNNGNVTCVFQLKDTKFEIVEYKSINGGNTWFSDKHITLDSSLDNSNPFYIRNKNIIDILWFYGDNNYSVGRNLRFHKSDAAAIKIIEARDCEFERDEDSDETIISFIISNTEPNQLIEVEIDHNAFINKNGINLEITIGVWTFTMES